MNDAVTVGADQGEVVQLGLRPPHDAKGSRRNSLGRCRRVGWCGREGVVPVAVEVVAGDRQGFDLLRSALNDRQTERGSGFLPSHVRGIEDLGSWEADALWGFSFRSARRGIDDRGTERALQKMVSVGCSACCRGQRRLNAKSRRCSRCTPASLLRRRLGDVDTCARGRCSSTEGSSFNCSRPTCRSTRGRPSRR